MENWTNLGVAGVTLAILAFIVRSFVETIKKKDEIIVDALTKTTQVIEKNTNSINANTEVTKQSTEASKTNADNFTKLVAEVMKVK